MISIRAAKYCEVLPVPLLTIPLNVVSPLTPFSTRGGRLVIDFKEIHPYIPGFVFNEYGQLTGNYVHYDKILCVSEKGRIQIWLDRESYDAQDPEKLICDYDE